MADPEHLRPRVVMNTTSSIREPFEEDKANTTIQHADNESYYSSEAPSIRKCDYKERQKFKGWTFLWLAYQSIGVIYGDIGTSPLYVYSSTFSSPPSREDLLGAVSLIIWTLTIIVTIKYMLIVLYADDNGEGGTFALYTLLSRYSDIMKRDPQVQQLVKMERYATNELHSSNRGIRAWIEKSRVAHAILKLLAVFGVSLILADGCLTPAQSVLGSIQGLLVVKPGISNHVVIGVSCAILVLLFLVQGYGVHRISSCFAPIVIIWLLLNGSFGIYNLAVHDASMLKAFSPYYAGNWFVRKGTTGWIQLGGILLAFTGVETLFADLGAFNRAAVQLSWLCLTYPCLLLAYIGQAAYLSDDPSAYDYPFYRTVPPGMLYPSLVFAILATIVASQATITGCFQLLSQIMNSSYFPHIDMRYTSTKFHGQVYIPIANWLLMIGTVIITAVYTNTTNLGHAYGFCVVLVTFVTTNMVALVAIIVWRIHPAFVFAAWLPIVAFDGLYLTSAATKVPSGAWFTLLLAVILAAFFSLWRYGKEKQWAHEATESTELSSIVAQGTDTTHALTERYGGGDLTEMGGLGIFFDKAGYATPKVYEQWLRKFRGQMEFVVFMHIRALSLPHVAEEDRFEVTKTSVNNVYRLMIRNGYRDHVITPDLARLIYEQVRRAILQDSVRGPPENATIRNDCEIEPEEQPADPRVADRLRRLDRAYKSQSIYLVGKQKMRVAAKQTILKRMILELFLWVRENSRSKIEKLNIPTGNLVEVGFVGEI